MATKKAATPVAKKATTACTMKTALTGMAEKHVPFGPGDTVSLVYKPFVGDIFGSKSSVTGYWGNSPATASFKVESYNAATKTYQVLDYYNDKRTVPFYCLKLKRKSDGRDVKAGNYAGRVSEAGTSATFGCQNVSFAQVEALYNTMKKVKSEYKPKPKTLTTVIKKKARK